MKSFRTLIIRNCRGITGMTGGETYLLSLLRGFESKNCKSLLVCIVNPKLGETTWLKELEGTGFDYVTIPVANPFSIMDIIAVTKLIKKFNADVVHALDHRSDMVGVICGRLTGRPVVASFLGWVNFTKGSWRAIVYPWIDRLILKRLDAVITDSVAIGDELQMKKDDPPVVAIRNGIDTKKFDPKADLFPFSQKSFTDPADMVFGMVGRIHPVKGHMIFLKSALKLLESNPKHRFLIVGTVLPGFEYYQQEIINFIEQHGLNDSVLMTHVTLEEIPDVFASIDVLVAPSYAESFSFTLLEGMAMEKAVVTTDVGGAKEMINDGETGYLFPVDGVTELTSKLEMLIENPTIIKKVGANARQKIIKDLGIDVMAERTLNVYAELIEFKTNESNNTEEKLRLREQLGKISA